MGLESDATSKDYTNKNHLTMDVTYHENGKFEIDGNINKKGQSSIIRAFLRGQTGKGKDPNPINQQDTYHISLRWFPEDDSIIAKYDTGNKGLRDGILIYVLSKLEKEVQTDKIIWRFKNNLQQNKKLIIQIQETITTFIKLKYPNL